ncbi:hypothetical protein T484DRAFT_1770891 [Baffinella frigidus]|nr:hypothetical protein T484DRAFT_1770891 [Cryptophyta sp. CCMP2293]
MFCLIYHYMLMTVDNTEFYDKQYPFSLPEEFYAKQYPVSLPGVSLVRSIVARMTRLLSRDTPPGRAQ